MILGLLLMRTQRDAAPSGDAARARVRCAKACATSRSVPELFVPLVMMAIIGTFAFNFQTVMPLLVKRTLHGTDRTFTLIYSFISRRIARRRSALGARERRSRFARSSCRRSAFGVAMLLLAVTPNVPFAYPIGMIVGISSITFMTTSTAIMQLRADPSMRGRVLALQAIVFLGQHAHRRTDPRLGVSDLRGTHGRGHRWCLGDRGRCLRLAGGVGADPVQGPPDPTADPVDR